MDIIKDIRILEQSVHLLRPDELSSVLEKIKEGIDYLLRQQSAEMAASQYREVRYTDHKLKLYSKVLELITTKFLDEGFDSELLLEESSVEPTNISAITISNALEKAVYASKSKDHNFANHYTRIALRELDHHRNNNSKAINMKEPDDFPTIQDQGPIFPEAQPHTPKPNNIFSYLENYEEVCSTKDDADKAFIVLKEMYTKSGFILSGDEKSCIAFHKDDPFNEISIEIVGTFDKTVKSSSSATPIKYKIVAKKRVKQFNPKEHHKDEAKKHKEKAHHHAKLASHHHKEAERALKEDKDSPAGKIHKMIADHHEECEENEGVMQDWNEAASKLAKDHVLSVSKEYIKHFRLKGKGTEEGEKNE